jgi:uncharacterized protein YegP (UPF0339 family)
VAAEPTTGRIVASSSDSYSSRAGARTAAERLQRDAASYKYLVDADDVGNYRWRASAASGQSVATSTESFASQHHADRAARELASSAARPWEPT